MFRQTMKSATRSCGRESAPTTTDSSGRPEVLRAREPGVDHRAQHAHHHAGPLRLDRARRDDRQRVERREIARHAARQIDERRHDDRVERQLHVDEPPVLLRLPQEQNVDDRQRVSQADQKEERIDRQRSGRLDLDQNRRPEQQRDDRRAAANQPQESASEVGGHRQLPASSFRLPAAHELPPPTAGGWQLVTGS